MLHPRIPWNLSEYFDPDSLDSEELSPETPDPESYCAQDTIPGCWDQMIFPF